MWHLNIPDKSPWLPRVTFPDPVPKSLETESSYKGKGTANFLFIKEPQQKLLTTREVAADFVGNAPLIYFRNAMHLDSMETNSMLGTSMEFFQCV